MAAMTSRFNIRCVIQYYSDQWATTKHLLFISDLIEPQIVKLTFMIRLNSKLTKLFHCK